MAAHRRRAYDLHGESESTMSKNAGGVGPSLRPATARTFNSTSVEAFIDDLSTAAGGNLRLLIRHKITKLENIVRSNEPSGIDAINSVLQLAKENVFQEITRHSPNGKSTPKAELFQEVFDALSTRLRTFVVLGKAGYQVSVTIPRSPSQVAKRDFPTVEAAQAWRDSDVGDTYIKTIIAERER